MINNAVHLNKTDVSKDRDYQPELPQPWVRTSLLFEYLSESKQSQLNPFGNINGENVTEVDFHVNASFDYIDETGIWGDGEKIDDEWWFRNSKNDLVVYKTNDTEFIIRDYFDQVKIFGSAKIWNYYF